MRKVLGVVLVVGTVPFLLEALGLHLGTFLPVLEMAVGRKARVIGVAGERETTFGVGGESRTAGPGRTTSFEVKSGKVTVDVRELFGASRSDTIELHTFDVVLVPAVPQQCVVLASPAGVYAQRSVTDDPRVPAAAIGRPSIRQRLRLEGATVIEGDAVASFAELPAKLPAGEEPPRVVMPVPCAGLDALTDDQLFPR